MTFSSASGSFATVNGLSVNSSESLQVNYDAADVTLQAVLNVVTANTWTGKGDGKSWSDVKNWSTQAMPTSSDNITIPAGVAVVQVGGGIYPVGSLTSSSPIEVLGNGTLKLYGASAITSTLAIDAGGSVDIQNYPLTINYAAGADPVASIRGYLKSASAGGIWTGAGLTSSTVRTQVAQTIANRSGGVWRIGYFDGRLDAGQSIATGNQLVIEPTLSGDADMNGYCNFLDLGRVAQNLGSINSDWYHGDFNYDGSVSFLDIGLLAQNLNKSTVNTPLIVAAQIPAAASVAAAAASGTPARIQPARVVGAGCDLLPDSMSATFAPMTSSSLLFSDNQLDEAPNLLA